MTESVGDKAINDSAASASEDSVYTLAHVLECEFSELHQGDLPKVTHEALGQDRTAVMEAKQQQPLADPSLSPANHQARAQCMEHPETDKTPSQQLDSDPDAKALRNLWERVHGLAGDGRTALCLSGGGVRSAAFNLGSLPTNTIAAATTSDRESLAQTWAPRSGIAFVLLGAVIFAFLAAKSIPQAASSWSWERLAVFPLIGAVGALVAFVLALCVAATKRVLCKSPKTVRWAVRYLGHVPEVPPGPVTVPTAGVHAVLLLALGVVAAGGAGGLVLGVGEELAAYLPKNNPWSTALVLSIAPLWFVISYNVGDAVFLGLTVRRPSPRKKLDWSDRWGDEEREWVARTGGYLMVIALGISVLCLLALFGPEFIEFVASFSWTGPVGLATVAILSALASIGLAANPFSTHFGTAPRGVRVPVRTILVIATPIFAGLLTLILSTALDIAVFKQPLLKLLSISDGSDGWFDARKAPDQGGLFALAFLLVARFNQLERI